MEPDEGGAKGSSGWGSSFKLLGAVGGLGIEMAAAVVAGAFLGQKGDEALGTGSALTVLGVLFGVMAFGVHVRYLLRRGLEGDQDRAREEER
jgi:hypothetical protein